MARILLVDDDAMVLTMLELCLKEEGHDVTAVASGAAALATLACGGIDIVVTDSLLGGPVGDAIAKSAQAAGVPVILMSGTPREDSSLPFLAKPFPAGRLMTTIDGLLQGFSARHQQA
jgi:DNA-binding response OmpR family regulator